MNKGAAKISAEEAVGRAYEYRTATSKPWSEVAEYFRGLCGEKIPPDSLRKRVSRYSAKNRTQVFDDFQPDGSKEYVDEDFNRIKLFKKAYFDRDVEKTPDVILRALGYSPDLFKLGKYTLSNWDVPSKDVNKDCFAIKAVILPKNEADLTPYDYVCLATEAFKGKIERRSHCQRPRPDRQPMPSAELEDRGRRLVEIPPIELHYGRLATDVSSHTMYNLDIAETYFYSIFDSVVERQKVERADECLVVIGSDFFNSESNGATTRGTQQHNVSDYRRMFIGGLRMYDSAIDMLSKVFPKVNVMLCAGNHARAMEFFLYCALKERFSGSDNVSFKEDYSSTQCFRFGNVGLFFNHGDVNQKRTIASIPAEFPKEWGATKFRELHMGHLHCEKVVDENAGIITRRIGSPCESDEWSYNERFIGSVKKHQTFTWDSINGLCSINYITIKEP